LTRLLLHHNRRRNRAGHVRAPSHVIPAKAGIQARNVRALSTENHITSIPAKAGTHVDFQMRGNGGRAGPEQDGFQLSLE